MPGHVQLILDHKTSEQTLEQASKSLANEYEEGNQLKTISSEESLTRKVICHYLILFLGYLCVIFILLFRNA